MHSLRINKIEGTPILKLAMVERLTVKKNRQKNCQITLTNSSKNLSKRFVKFVEKIRQKYFVKKFV